MLSKHPFPPQRGQGINQNTGNSKTAYTAESTVQLGEIAVAAEKLYELIKKYCPPSQFKNESLLETTKAFLLAQYALSFPSIDSIMASDSPGSDSNPIINTKAPGKGTY